MPQSQLSGVYFVEELRDRRILPNGAREYLVKWKGWDENNKTWEPEGHFNPALIQAFERNRQEKLRQKRKLVDEPMTVGNKRPMQPPRNNPVDREPFNMIVKQEVEDLINPIAKTPEPERTIITSPPPTPPHTDAVGFERGLPPEKILGAVSVGGEVRFLMKWQGSDDSDLVPAREANVKCPQVVIRFYQERITWQTKFAVSATGNH